MCFFLNHPFLKFLKTEQRSIDIKEKTPAEDSECSGSGGPCWAPFMNCKEKQDLRQEMMSLTEIITIIVDNLRSLLHIFLTPHIILKLFSDHITIFEAHVKQEVHFLNPMLIYKKYL